MSVLLRLTSPDHPGETVQLASASGWVAVAEWAEKSGPVGLRKLVLDGEIHDTERLSQELLGVETEGNVQKTLDELTDALAGGSPNETATVFMEE